MLSKDLMAAVAQRGSRGLYVQYGAGRTGPSQWVNFDASPTLRIQRIPLIGRIIVGSERRFAPEILYGDIVRGLPIPPDSVDGLYASHVLVHLSLEDCLIALDNSRKVLKPGGIFRLIVPDLRARAERYVSDRGRGHGAHWFMRSSGLGREVRGRGIVDRLGQMFGNAAHLWLWDEESMRKALAGVGFAHIRRCEFGDAQDPIFRLVEVEGRFYENGIRELAIEARK